MAPAARRGRENRPLQSVSDRGAGLAPPLKIDAAPCDGSRGQTDRRGKLVLRDEAVDRRAAESRHADDGPHAHEKRAIVAWVDCDGVLAFVRSRMERFSR